jgi:hypothetical protein
MQYIGQTKYGCEVRQAQHVVNAFVRKREMPLARAIREHGAAAFTIELRQRDRCGARRQSGRRN